MPKLTELEKKALSYLPEHLRESAVRTASLWNSAINEIRLRGNRLMSLTVDDRNVSCGIICTYDDIFKTVLKICKNSMYSYSDSIKNGFIPAEGGIRVGVCGQAVTQNEKITAVRDISSVNIRIPHRINGAGDKLYELSQNGKSVLVYSPPGIGKTTALRELIPLLSAGEERKRVAVIDTRYELCSEDESAETADILSGYPRFEGIMTAVRTLSPEYIICDEISSDEDAAAIKYAHYAGIAVCASIHASDFNELALSPVFRGLLESSVFDFTYGISLNNITVMNLKNGERYVYQNIRKCGSDYVGNHDELQADLRIQS